MEYWQKSPQEYLPGESQPVVPEHILSLMKAVKGDVLTPEEIRIYSRYRTVEDFFKDRNDFATRYMVQPHREAELYIAMRTVTFLHRNMNVRGSDAYGLTFLDDNIERALLQVKMSTCLKSEAWSPRIGDISRYDILVVVCHLELMAMAINSPDVLKSHIYAIPVRELAGVRSDKIHIQKPYSGMNREGKPREEKWDRWLVRNHNRLREMIIRLSHGKDPELPELPLFKLMGEAA